MVAVPSNMPTMEDHNNLLDRLRVLEVAEQRREERYDYMLTPAEMVTRAYQFQHSPFFKYVEEHFVQFEDEGYYNVDDEETHIYDELVQEFGEPTARDFRNQYAPIKAVVTRLLMRKYPWARPSKGRCVTRIRSCKADPYLIKNDGLGFAWLQRWLDEKAKQRAKRQKAKADA